MLQNKGVITFFAVLLALVCLFYLSFTFATRPYYKQAEVYAAGNQLKESQFLDSIASKKVWLGYTLKKSRAMELNLGLDLKGGMSVIMELNVADVLKSLSNHNPDPKFNQALANATERRLKSNSDYITLFTEEYRKLDPGARLSAIFSTFELKDKITRQSSDADVEKVLRSELKSAIDNSFNVLRNRIDRFGVVAPNIQRLQTEGRISIELPGIKERERVRSLLQGSANLEFWETFNQKDIYQALLTANNIIRDSLANVQTATVPDTTVIKKTETAANVTKPAAKDSTQNSSLEEEIAKLAKTDSAALTEDATANGKTSGNDEALNAFQKNYPLFYLLNANPQQTYSGPILGKVHKRDRELVDKYLNMRQVKEVLPYNFIARWSVKAVDDKEEFFELYALKTSTREGRPALEGDVVTSAKDEFTQNSSSAEVSMKMNSEGAKKWARLTKDNIGKSVAIVLDNMVYSAPTVQVEIPNGESRITGHFTAEDAKDLANVLKSGKMSAPARIVQEEVIGPSLGQESINKGFFAFLLALVLLMGYLIVVYGVKPGIIADLALLLNLFFTMGVLASFHAVLTLSGIAGMVLALHVAVDANVLIYERIKEEIRGGKKVKNAVEEGYHKAFSAIFDSNLTAIITGVILFFFGTGPIKGFATTMIIGIVISFITAVFLTRVVYENFMERGKLLDLTFNTSLTKNFLVNPKFNLMKNRRLIYGVNIGIVAICLIALIFRGLNQGIDFTGGRNYTLRFEQDVNTAEAQTLLEPLFENHPPVITTIGTPNKIRVSTNYKNADNSEGVDKEITQKLYDGLKHLLPEGTTYQQFSEQNMLSSQIVGPSIAADIKFHAYLAVIIAIFAIGAYILLRFRDVSYSVGTIVALIGDALFIMGIYALLWGFVPFSLEVDQTFIGAILTAIGYSINDKVVIFDRVREYTHLYPKRDKYEIFNEALNSTLDRTFNTSTSAFLVMIIILFVAGDSIRSFSFAMLLGVIVGTFSSLFTAAPVAFEIQDREHKKKIEKK
jgi:SecD/SecF fusion protein